MLTMPLETLIRSPNLSVVMAVISLVHYKPHLHQFVRRSWAGRNPGVILVFCIVFIIAVGLITLFLYRRVIRKKAEKEAFTG
jgi:uncharacterized membrane protein